MRRERREKKRRKKELEGINDCSEKNERLCLEKGNDALINVDETTRTTSSPYPAFRHSVRPPPRMTCKLYWFVGLTSDDDDGRIAPEQADPRRIDVTEQVAFRATLLLTQINVGHAWRDNNSESADNCRLRENCEMTVHFCRFRTAGFLLQRR